MSSDSSSNKVILAIALIIDLSGQEQKAEKLGGYYTNPSERMVTWIAESLRADQVLHRW